MIEKEQQKSEIIAANKVIGIKLVESCNSVTNPNEWAANNDQPPLVQTDRPQPLVGYDVEKYKKKS